MDNFLIKKINDLSELHNCVKVIQQSFITVAKQFNLTKENAPTNATFISVEDLIKMQEKGIQMFSAYQGSNQVGFAAIEKSDNSVFFLEKLSVIPEYRYNGYAKRIMDFVFDYAAKEGGCKISIGVINENVILKKWYQEYGFIETGVRNFGHLPFGVCFMEKQVV